MENRVESSDGVDIPKKTRSLDLQSLYKSKVSKESINDKILKRKRRLEGGDGKDEGESESKKKKRKKSSRKEVSLSSFEHVGKKNKKSLDEVYSGGGGLSRGSRDLDKTQLGSLLKSDNTSSSSELSQKLNSISLSLDDNALRIPKRRRGFVRRKKFEGNQVLRQVAPSSSKAGVVGQETKLTDDSSTKVDSGTLVESGTQVESLKVKRKKGFDDFKENKSSGSNGSNSAHNFKEEDGNSNAYNGDSSSRKPRKNRRKRKDLALDSRSSAKAAKPSVDKSMKICDDLQEDDEENLEQNAARMLSSRFDPNCTGFSSNKKASASLSTNGLSLLMSSGRNFVSRRRSSLAGSESVSVDAAGRVLRPRKQYREKDLLRKRRHFYEILSGDLDAYWVLNRRIKVFWPLDQSWYFGLVSGYDPDRKLHHVKYDDRDEEWINLQNERFKLLLLPSEVPGKADKKSSVVGVKCAESGKGDMTTEDDSYMGSYMDSEPIISWLVRSTRRVKSSPFGTMKRRKTSSESPNLVSPLLSNRTVNAHRCLDASSLKRVKNKRLSCNSALPDRLDDAREGENSLLESTTCRKEARLPIVYFRRRFRQRGLESCHTPVEGHVCRSAPESVSSLAPVVDGYEFLEKDDISSRLLDHDGPLWGIDDSGLLKFTIPLIESRTFRFELNCPVFPVLNYLSGVENFWLFRAVLLLQYGTVMNMWPKVHLEMLFVDNIVGLRFFLFEGCLKQAVAFVFMVLTFFHQPIEQGNYFDLQVPVTSIRFKLSRVEDLRKQLVFAFYSIFKVKSSKWLDLDCKLKRHCLLTKQLPLSECTYDNIKALQSGTNQLLVSSVCGETSTTEVLQKRSKQSIFCMGVSKESAHVNMTRSSSKEKHRLLPPFSLSFTAAPTFFLSLHLKLLMEHSVTRISFPGHDSMSLLERAENSGSLMADNPSLVEDCSNKGLESFPGHDTMPLLERAACFGLPSSANPGVATEVVSVCSDDHRRKPSWKHQNGDLNGAGNSANSQDPVNNDIDSIVQLQKWQYHHSESEQLSPRPLILRDLPSVGKSDSSSYSSLNGISIDIPPFNQVEDPVNGGSQSARRYTDSWNMNDGLIRSPNPTAPRSACHRNRNSFSSPFGYLSHGPDGKAEFYRNGFGSGPKKPRTQVSYMSPSGGFDFSSKDRSHLQKGLSHKRIRRANERKTLDGSRSSQRDLELLSCDANVLITLGDRGWRECGARVVLELVDHNEWRLAVKISGSTKYSYKAHQFLQPGSTNRYTHAMMWKGGKDWILEFPDRSQWTLFKEMHEECYNRNIRAASVKNIPIPGVRLIEECDDNGSEVAFVRSSPKYFRQVESDVDMALDPSRILYDMDSDDERWMMKNQNSSENSESGGLEISDELFEKTMDMFEKVAYDEQRDQFTSKEIDELMVGVGPMDVIKTIHEHWRQKRQSKEMPLVRQLQPPLWERYQQQVKEWELAMTKTSSALSNGCHVKAAATEKPPMFAFCLKPRGLEVPNKGSKQRSQRRFPVAGQSYAILDQDGYHAFGRRLNGFAFGDEKVIYSGHSHDSSDVSPLLQTSTRVFSLRDTASTGYFSMSNDGFERNHHPKLHRTKSKKIGTYLSSSDLQMVGSFNQRTVGKRNGVQRWNMGLPEWPSQKNYQSEGSQRLAIEQLDGSDLDEFRLRDASGAAQHALNMAKLKREKAQRLLYRADLAIHKAVVALMTAEAIKDSSDDINGDG